MGRLERIWVKRAMRGLMDPAESVELLVGRGIVGNADQGGRRPVTLISAERWAKAEAEIGVTLDPALRRANLLVSGLDLVNSRGRVLSIGGCRVKIGGETRPCRVMEDAHTGLQAALDRDWGGGAYAKVLEAGTISVGDIVTLD